MREEIHKRRHKQIAMHRDLLYVHGNMLQPLKAIQRVQHNDIVQSVDGHCGYGVDCVLFKGREVRHQFGVHEVVQGGFATSRGDAARGGFSIKDGYNIMIG